MKKLFSVILILATILGLCACGGSGSTENPTDAQPAGLQAGYSKQSIMPEGPVGLGGYANADTRKSTGFIDYVYVSCIAFREGEDTVLLFTADMCGGTTKVIKTLRNMVSASTGVPENNIMFSSSHSHTSPSVGADEDYTPIFYNAVVAAGTEAIADLAPATLHAANVQTEGMNFVRHYIQEDGTYSSANMGNLDLTTVKDHAREADPEMVVILAKREGDKKDIMLMNWQAHPCFDGGSDSTLIHADYIGTARAAVEQAGMHFSFIQGGGGDVVTDSRIPTRKHGLDRTQYGQKLAQYAIDAIPTMEQLTGDGIQIRQSMTECPCVQPDTERLAAAQQVTALIGKNSAAAKTLAKQLGFFSTSEARGVVGSMGNPVTDKMELNSICIAGVGFATAPWEMFSDTCIYIKDHSPFKYTVVCSITNGYRSYIPTSAAFDYPGYERSVAYFGKGAAEIAADELVRMLKEMQ